MERYDAPRPLQLPSAVHGLVPFTRADVVLHEVDHSGISYEGRIFFNAPGCDAQTPIDDAGSGYAGSFYVFGHWRCVGEAGHCHPVPGRLDAYDMRPPHKLTPYKMTVEVTDAATRLVKASVTEVRVSVVPVPVPLLDDDATTDLLHFRRLSLLTYEP
jgi:hypothetical protein